ncbi:DUF927 domain-containing protein [Thiomicrorhabdus indica]|uniref:DUF927 domain-containing protein n=1 Tax=Thiomicrorhabdus indica TaxID=2267253 RepID=UPI00102DFF4A|nr:DUF927 domain-containing protein [Thiomicrorhabdus indica]
MEIYTSVKLIAESSIDVPESDKCNKTYKLIEFHNRDGEMVGELISHVDYSSPTRCKEFLLSNGFPSASIHDKGRLDQIMQLINENAIARVLVVRRPGWHGGVYLSSSNEVIGTLSNQLGPMLAPDLDCQLPRESKNGSGNEWKAHVSSFMQSSSRLMLAVCSGLSGVLIRYSNVQTGGFHFYGDSSIGKSTMLLVAASVYGNRDFVRDWNMTETGAEELAEGASDSLLVLDELKLLHSSPVKAVEIASQIIYNLSEGRGKCRSKAYQSFNRKWHLVMISAGELSLNNHAKQSGLNQMAGEQVRVIDIPADAGEELGIFETIPYGYTSSAMAIDGIKELINKHNGHAKNRFRKRFVELLQDHGEDFIKKRIARSQKKFLDRVLEGVEVNGQQKRIADRFALAYVAGVMAIKFRILELTEEEVFEGIKKCFDDAVNSRFEVYETKKVKALKKAFKMYFDDELVIDLTSGSDAVDFESGKAFKTKVKGKLVIAIPSKEIKGAATSKDFKELWAQPDWSDAIVKNSEGRNTHQIMIGNQKPRCYCFDYSMLDQLS